MRRDRLHVELEDARTRRVFSRPPRQRSWHERITPLALAAGILVFLMGAGSFITTPESADVLAALVLVPLEALAVAVIVRLAARPSDRSFLTGLVAAGFLLRIGATLLFHARLPVTFFAPDQFTFQDVGWRTLLYMRGLGPRPFQLQGIEVGHFYWNAALYSVFGFAPVAPKLLNAMMGSLTGVVAYRFAGELAGERGARTAAFLVTLFPSLILWSTQNLRDTPALLLLTLILWQVLRLRVRPTATALVPVALGVLALVFVRDYMAVMVTFAVVGSFLISGKRRILVNLLIGGALFGAALYAYRATGMGDGLLDSASFEMLNTQRQNLATGRTAFQPEVDISTPMKGLQYLPIGLAFFFLSPFPWMLGSALSIMTLPEQAIWYALLPMVLYGGWFLTKNRFNRVAPTLLFIVLTSSVYALVEGNAGTAYRHRAQIVVFMLIFGAVGIEAWRVRRRGSGRARTRIRPRAG